MPTIPLLLCGSVVEAEGQRAESAPLPDRPLAADAAPALGARWMSRSWICTEPCADRDEPRPARYTFFVIDGTPVVVTGQPATFPEPWANLRPEDIAHVEIMRGSPAAVARFGPQAEHGVVLITTKRGTQPPAPTRSPQGTP